MDSKQIVLFSKVHLPASAGDDPSTAEAGPGRDMRAEQGEARRASRTPSYRPHLDPARLRLNRWSKTDFSIAQTIGEHIYKCALA